MQSDTGFFSIPFLTIPSTRFIFLLVAHYCCSFHGAIYHNPKILLLNNNKHLFICEIRCLLHHSHCFIFIYMELPVTCLPVTLFRKVFL